MRIVPACGSIAQVGAERRLAVGSRRHEVEPPVRAEDGGAEPGHDVSALVFEASVHRWIDGLAGELVRRGADEATARIQARVHLAAARGLLLEQLATGNREEVNQAYEHYLQFSGHAAEQPPSGR